MISLVNLCSCAGLEGLIRPGTSRPAGHYPSVSMKDLAKAEIRLKSTFISVLTFYTSVMKVSARPQGAFFKMTKPKVRKKRKMFPLDSR